MDPCDPARELPDGTRGLLLASGEVGGSRACDGRRDQVSEVSEGPCGFWGHLAVNSGGGPPAHRPAAGSCSPAAWPVPCWPAGHQTLPSRLPAMPPTCTGLGIMHGYWQLPEATEKAFPLGREAGLFDTGAVVAVPRLWL